MGGFLRLGWLVLLVPLACTPAPSDAPEPSGGSGPPPLQSGPDAGLVPVDTPDGGTPSSPRLPDAGTGRPDAGTAKPDAGTTKPDAGSGPRDPGIPLEPEGPDDGEANGGPGGLVPVDTSTWQPTTCTPTGWCWISPLPHGEALTATWGTGPTDLWTASAHLLSHWDGARWTTYPTPGAISALWGAGPDDVWAVGERILHWDGVRWSEVPAPARRYTSVWGSGPQDVWAVGDDGMLSFWNGASWADFVPQPLARLTRVWASGPQDVWVGGERSALLRWDGSAWQDHSVPPVCGAFPGDEVTCESSRITALWGSGPQDVWAARPAGDIFHWDGSVWSNRPLPEEGAFGPAPTRALGGTGPLDVWARGGRFRWTGERWEPQPHGSPQAAAVGSGGAAVWFAGGSGALQSSVVLTREGAWSNLVPLSGIALHQPVAAGRDDVWFAAFVRDRPGAVFHWDGQRLTRHRVLEREGLRVLRAASPDDVWAVGERGKTAHWDGARWTLWPSSVTAACTTPTRRPPYECRVQTLWGAAGDVRAFSVEQGTGVPSFIPLHWDGRIWRRTGPPVELRSEGGFAREVRLVGAREAWAWGDESALFHWNGSAWSPVSVPGQGVLFFDLVALAPDDVWAVGRKDVEGRPVGALWHWDGARWQEVAVPEGFFATRAGALGPRELFFGGSGLWRFDGQGLHADETLRAFLVTGIAAAGGDVLVTLESSGALRLRR